MSLPEAPEAFLFQQLTTETTVAGLIGSRVFPLIAPTGTPLPLVVYQRVGVKRERSLTGNAGVPVVTMQVTSYGSSYTTVKQIARAVRLAVDNFSGASANATIQRTTLTNEYDGVDMPQDDQMLPYYSVIQTFEFRVQEQT
jgi:hypothetical protein